MGVIELKGITYSYTKDRPVLKGIDAVFDAGKMYVLFGPSGCGKTTLLSLLGGLDIPSGGSVFYDGEDIRDIGLENHRHCFRKCIAHGKGGSAARPGKTGAHRGRSEAQRDEAFRRTAAAGGYRPRPRVGKPRHIGGRADGKP